VAKRQGPGELFRRVLSQRLKEWPCRLGLANLVQCPVPRKPHRPVMALRTKIGTIELSPSSLLWPVGYTNGIRRLTSTDRFLDPTGP
jgi:hypothetical protein